MRMFENLKTTCLEQVAKNFASSMVEQFGSSFGS